MKNVLVITYSQSGQLDEIVENILQPLQGKVNLFQQQLKPEPSFPFPWTDLTFWDVMPESVEMIPAKIKPLEFDRQIKYDLIILGYPIWFLSPPISLTTFLKSEEAKTTFGNTPIVTVIGSRNMWVNAQEDIKKMIAGLGGIHVGNISLRDRHHNLPSVVTIIYWMMTGKKDRYLGIFPKPGVSDKDINEAAKFGIPVLSALETADFGNLQNELLELNAIELEPAVVSIENKGKRIFKIWSKFILKKGGPGNKERTTRLKMFKWYLLFVIFAVSPLATLIFYLTYPFFFLKINRKMAYYKGVKM